MEPTVEGGDYQDGAADLKCRLSQYWPGVKLRNLQECAKRAAEAEAEGPRLKAGGRATDGAVEEGGTGGLAPIIINS